MADSLNVNFYPNYLYRNRPGNAATTGQRTINDVIYCPTDQWHRLFESSSVLYSNLIGYVYLPGGTSTGWIITPTSALAQPKEAGGKLSPGADCH